MITKRLHHSRSALRDLRTQEKQHRDIIRHLQCECEHAWKVHSHYPKPYGDTSKVAKWWTHLTCPLCDAHESLLEDAPICTHCLQPLQKYTADDEAAQKIQAEVSALDTYPTLVYVFGCELCRTLVGLPVRIDKKKK